MLFSSDLQGVGAGLTVTVRNVGGGVRKWVIGWPNRAWHTEDPGTFMAVSRVQGVSGHGPWSSV